MKILLSKLLLSKAPLERLVLEKLPARTSYIIMKNVELANKEFSSYEEIKNKLIIEKYGEEKGTGEWRVPPERMKDFIKEMEDFVSLEIDINITPISLPDDCRISVVDLNLLDWMINMENS